MPEETLKPSWKIPAILSALLLLFIIGGPPVEEIFYRNEMDKLVVLWVLVKFVLAFAAYSSWSKGFKRVPGLASGKAQYFRGAVPAFITGAVVALGWAVTHFMAHPESGETAQGAVHQIGSNPILVIIFSYITLLFLARGILILVVKAFSGDQPGRIVTGIADGVLIFLNVVAYLVWKAFIVRLLIVGAVVAGIRVGWGFVPEERLEIVREFMLFLKERKLWWMTPIFIVLGLLVLIVLLTESTGGSFPFIYAIF